MWSAEKVSADFANGVQVNAGILLNTFDVASPVEPQDSDIVGATTGDFSIVSTTTYKNIFENVNNLPKSPVKEGIIVDSWTGSLSINMISITEEILKMSLGASVVEADSGISPGVNLVAGDFKTLYWIGDMIDSTKLLVVKMENALSTGGINFTSKKSDMGTLAVTLNSYAALSDRKKIPMTFYILTKSEGVQA